MVDTLVAFVWRILYNNGKLFGNDIREFRARAITV